MAKSYSTPDIKVVDTVAENPLTVSNTTPSVKSNDNDSRFDNLLIDVSGSTKVSNDDEVY